MLVMDPNLSSWIRRDFFNPSWFYVLGSILFYLSWYLNLLGGPRLGAEIVILTSSNSAVPLRCHVVFDPPGTHKFVKRG